MDKEQVGYICMGLDSIREAILGLHPTADESRADNDRLLTENHTLKAELYQATARVRDAEGLLGEIVLEAEDFIKRTGIQVKTWLPKAKDFLAKGGKP